MNNAVSMDRWFKDFPTDKRVICGYPAAEPLAIVTGKPSDDLAPGSLISTYKQAGWKYRLDMKYAVVIKQASSNYSAYGPGLPGCVATGSTIEEVEREMKEAIEFHLEGLKNGGLSIPIPNSSVEYIEVAT